MAGRPDHRGPVLGTAPSRIILDRILAGLPRGLCRSGECSLLAFASSVAVRLALRLASQGDGRFGDLNFAAARTLANFFDDVAILIARRERHLGVTALRIFFECAINQADTFEKFLPVQAR